MSNSYFIRLTPLSTFFFGTEKNFGSDDTAPTNYLVRSRMFPQQTSVLGLLRYCLLVSDKTAFDTVELRIKDEKGAEKLIGKTGFRVDAVPPFGAIKRLSPVSIYHQQAQLLPICKGVGFSLKLDTIGTCLLNGLETTNKVPLLLDEEGEPYSDKNGFSDQAWISSSGIRYGLKASDSSNKAAKPIFVQHEQVGILKNKANLEDDDTDAFYKQFAWRMNPGYAFGVHVVLENAVLPEKKSIVKFGGEGSSFMMEIEPQDYPDQTKIPTIALPGDKLPKVVLLSDSYVSMDTIRPMIDFLIGEAIDFRFLESSVDMKDFDSLSADKSKNKVRRSTKYRLLQRGTVLYPKAGKVDALAKVLLQEPFHSIGYNHFQVQLPSN